MQNYHLNDTHKYVKFLKFENLAILIRQLSINTESSW